MKTRALLALAGCLLALSTRADDWPQFRGPNRDNASKETGLLKAWPEAGPKLLWTYKDAGTGYSGPAIVGDTLYTMGARGDDEFLIALDLTKTPPVQKWAEKIGPTFTTKGNIWNKGPSSSPTVANGYVYALGGFGDLICVTTDGKFIWRVALVKDLKGEINPIQNTPGTLAWGYAGSPLVDGDKLICVPGGPNGTVAALDAKKGNVVWRSVMFTEQATYTSPVMATLGGIKQYIVMVQDGVAGIDADGNLLWRYQRSNPYDEILASTPVVKDDLVFISGVKGGTELLKVTAAAGKFKAEQVFKDRRLENFVGGTALVGDTIYGCSGMGRSEWFAFDLKKQKLAWRKADTDVPQGAVTAADGKLYLLDEKGDVGLAEASPKEWNLISHFTLPEESKLRLPSSRVWTVPVVADGKLYLRDQELLFCYQVKRHGGAADATHDGAERSPRRPSRRNPTPQPLLRRPLRPPRSA